VTWEEVVVPALRDGSLVQTSVRFSAGDVCVVDVRMDHGPATTGEGPDLFEALVAARRVLEADGVLLACNGCRRDVFPSPMLRQSASGRRAYVLTMPRSEVKPPTVDIFETALDLSLVVTVDEQQAWFDRWRPTDPGRASA
jgi:hypothetical protein